MVRRILGGTAMKRSTDRILTTFAGSLIRPPEVLALGPDTDDATRTATLRTAVAEVVRKEAEVGVDVVSDGEFGKSNWFTYVMDRLDGYEVRPVERPDDRRARSATSRVIRISGRRSAAGRPAVRSATCACDRSSTSASRVDAARRRQLSQRAPGRRGPGRVSAGRGADQHLRRPHQRVLRLSTTNTWRRVADALHEEYKTITDAGLIVQLDDAILTHWYDRITAEGGDYRKWVAQASRSDQPRAARHPRGAGPLPRVLGLVARVRTPATCRSARSPTW